MADIGRELGWDDTIENDSEFQLLPDGDYDFEVIGFERARHNGSEKLPPCNKAVVSLRFETPEGLRTTIKENLFLHTSQEGKLCAFFTSIGHRKHGEKLKMDWNKVVGAKGRARIFIDKWTGNDGREYENNKVKRYLEPDDTATDAPEFTPGNF
jgi:hypothetical protein